MRADFSEPVYSGLSGVQLGTVYVQVRGVIKENERASGVDEFGFTTYDTVYVANYNLCEQFYDVSGTFQNSFCTQVRETVVVKNDELQVYRSRQSGEFTNKLGSVSGTCILSLHVVYAQGQTRVENYQLDCTPPS